MATESKGLLGRMAKMLRTQNTPSTDWNSLDTQGVSRNEPYSKAALKKMIERRRHNDYVRKREFEMLRKLRNRSKGDRKNTSMRPSFFASSMQTRTRENSQETIQKINQIEAQMSMQWWKNKHVAGALKDMGGQARALAPTEPAPLGQGDGGAQQPFPSPEQAQKAARKQAAARQQTRPVAAPATPRPPAVAPVPPVAPAVAPVATPTAPAAPMQPPVRPPVQPPAAAQTAAAPVAAPAAPGAPSQMASNFSPSRLFVQEMDDVLHDPDLEEAAILFANGDDSGTEQTLKDAIAEEGSKTQDVNTWLTLIDLYRATGNREGYDAVALHFVERFSRSAPQWFSLPDLSRPEKQAASPVAESEKRHDWKSPSKMTTTSVATLKAALQAKAQPWVLDWTPLSSIEDEALEPLLSLFREWAQSSGEIHFLAAKTLSMVLAAQTSVNDTSIDQRWWELRMEHARVICQQEEFETLALDFCVTYEVSPPSWRSVSHVYRDLDSKSDTQQLQIGDSVLDSIITSTSELDSGEVVNTVHQLAGIELAGVLLGDAGDALQTLDERRGDHDVLVIDCNRLMRVDFSAAGGILNWVISMHGKGVLVQFSNLHRLISSLFHVLGISEHAKVLARKD